MKRPGDGKPDIILDVVRLKERHPRISAALAFSPIFMITMISSPIVILIGGEVGSYISASIIMLPAILLVAYLWYDVFRKKSPLSYGRFRLFLFSPRVFFPGALIWMANVQAAWAGLFLIAAAWAFIEWLSYRRCREITDEQIVSGYRRSFRGSVDGAILYDPSTAKPSQEMLRDKHSPSRMIEVLPAAILFFAGPALFIRSQLLREDFEARFLIVTAFAVGLGLATRFVLTDYCVTKRALSLKRQSL